MKNCFYSKEEFTPKEVVILNELITFTDNPRFITAYSPLRMIELGVFGLGYFGIKEVDSIHFDSLLNKNPEFSKHMDLIHERTRLHPQDFSKNFYEIQSGLDHEFWIDNNLIRDDDPYGWFNWYINFYYGRRHSDDNRQINRYRSFVKRHWGMLRGYCERAGIPLSDAEFRYQKTCQNLLQWSWDYLRNPNDSW